MKLEEALAKIAELTEQLRVERDKHRDKDRLYLKGLADLKEAHAARERDADAEWAKERERYLAKHADDLKRLAAEHDKALAAALAETPEARARRDELEEIRKEADRKTREVRAAFLSGGAKESRLIPRDGEGS